MSQSPDKPDKTPLTTAFGAPVADNQNSMTAGPRGPLLMQDVWLIEKLANLNREIIPERRMHAKGSGAFGTFTVTSDWQTFEMPVPKQSVDGTTPITELLGAFAWYANYPDGTDPTTAPPKTIFIDDLAYQ